MKIKRAGSIPLVLHDPFFSVWSNVDNLYEADTVHWSGRSHTLRGYVKVNDAMYCFMGDKEWHSILPQKSVNVTATATEYLFENDVLSLAVRFTSPLVLTNPVLVSRPCTYVDFTVKKKVECDVSIIFEATKDLVTQQNDKVVGDSFYRPGKGEVPDYSYCFMGRANQNPLGSSGDKVTIDWGYLYLASTESGAQMSFEHLTGKLCCQLPIIESEHEAGLIIAYDDLIAMNYFGEWRRAFWTKEYATILDAIGAAFADKESVILKAKELDEEIYKKAMDFGGESYAYLCNMSYRQTVAAHKLICDEAGDIIFLSKENDSNGCVGTVDVSYPSVPLFLLYDTEYVKGMLRPIFRFSECDVWDEDFAPHDVGRYPYAWGQVYRQEPTKDGINYDYSQGSILPPYYIYPTGSDVYVFANQMPVEECGNMLIMTAAVCMQDGNADFAKPYKETLNKWVQYLITYGSDPGEQLCTDDFAGHLAHNVNLSAKAIMGIEAYSILMGMMGDDKAQEFYHKQAQEMASDWEKRADAGDHYMLAFGEPDTWSLKYNLVWDKLFESNLFSKDVYEKELAWYEKQSNCYGIPLDSRKSYTKSDWILWCVAMTDDKEQANQMIKPIADYLENTTTRVPFSDWYDTVTGKYQKFIARSVQGGIFMPLLREQKKKGDVKK